MALELNGSSQYVKVADDGYGIFDKQSFSVCAWVYIATMKDGVIFSYDNTNHIAPYYAIQLRIKVESIILFGFNISGSYKYVLTGADLSTSKWHHIVATFTSGSQKVYIDNVEKGSGTESGTITFYHREARIGDSPNFDGVFSGYIADVRFYDRALSLAEIQAIYSPQTRGSDNIVNGLVGDG